MAGKPSKSALKRDQHARQALGERLIELSRERLDRMPLDDALREAIVAAASMRSRGALRRQKQLIGKLMRDLVRKAPRFGAHLDHLAHPI